MEIKPQVIFAECQVEYNGRASSTLEVGKYLVLIKSDGTLIVHGDNLLKPKNYMGPKARIDVNSDCIVATKKKETIRITLIETKNTMDINDWSTNKIELKGSEADICNAIVENINTYVSGSVSEIIREYKTKVGNVDICVIDEFETYHIIEVKRTRASLAAVSQLHRYMLDIAKPRMQGYIIAPSITDSALEFLESLGYKFLVV